MMTNPTNQRPHLIASHAVALMPVRLGPEAGHHGGVFFVRCSLLQLLWLPLELSLRRQLSASALAETRSTLRTRSRRRYWLTRPTAGLLQSSSFLPSKLTSALAMA